MVGRPGSDWVVLEMGCGVSEGGRGGRWGLWCWGAGSGCSDGVCGLDARDSGMTESLQMAAADDSPVEVCVEGELLRGATSR